ncbi:MAG: hypothetical protein JW702_05325 [Clostridiales bacterium]|nr:hypothetical protein [Clostridiales bacterium]
MQIFILLVFVLNMGLYQIHTTLLNQQKNAKKNKIKFTFPKFYNLKLLLIILNLSPITILVAGIALFFVFDWTIALSVIIASIISLKFIGKITEIILINPISNILGKKSK